MFRIVLLTTLTAISLWGQIQFTPHSVAAVDDPLAVVQNPAGLAFNPHTESILFSHYNGTEFTKDFAYYSQAKTAGFAYQWDVLSGTNIWRMSQAFKVTRSQAVGLTYSWSDAAWREGRIDLGWMHRPLPMLALGANIKNIWTGQNQFMAIDAGVAFQSRSGRWGGGFDLGVIEDDSGAEVDYITSQNINAFIEPMEGVRLNTWVDLGTTDAVGFGISLALPDAAVETHTLSANANAVTIALRTTENPYRSLFKSTTVNRGKKNYIRMKLDGLYMEEPAVKKRRVPFDFNIPIPFLSNPAVYGKQLRVFIDQMDEYTADPNVDGLIIDVGYVRGGFGKMTDMRNAFQRFHDAGKEIIVYSKYGLSNLTTYLLSMADEIYTHEMAGVDLRGLGMEITFYRGLLDTLSIVPEVWRVSPYKTAGDMYLNSKMSDAMRENYSQLLDGLYDEFVAGIAEGKEWTTDSTQAIIDAGPYLLTEQAMEAGLLTGTMYPDEFDEYVGKLNEGAVNILKAHDREEPEAYHYAWRDDKVQDRIAVIYAVGGIISGKTRPGPSGSTSMGDETIARAIKQAREDESIKAIVLRIDSGGGSALASDIMWREILKTTETDSANVKPLIASMSDIAASGGYYIACQADSIIAYPSTVTGSIGVIGSRLNFSQLRERFGINTDRIKRGERSDFLSGARLTTDEETDMILASINDTYRRFKERVIKGREDLNDMDALDSLALGRVWTGRDAKAHGLIDEVGGYYAAIDLAKSAAGIEGDVEIVELPNYTEKNELVKMLSERSRVEQMEAQILERLQVNDLIPILEGDEIQMILPVQIEIK